MGFEGPPVTFVPAAWLDRLQVIHREGESVTREYQRKEGLGLKRIAVRAPAYSWFVGLPSAIPPRRRDGQGRGVGVSKSGWGASDVEGRERKEGTEVEVSEDDVPLRRPWPRTDAVFSSTDPPHDSGDGRHAYSGSSSLDHSLACANTDRHAATRMRVAGKVTTYCARSAVCQAVIPCCGMHASPSEGPHRYTDVALAPAFRDYAAPVQLEGIEICAPAPVQWPSGMPSCPCAVHASDPHSGVAQWSRLPHSITGDSSLQSCPSSAQPR